MSEALQLEESRTVEVYAFATGVIKVGANENAPSSISRFDRPAVPYLGRCHESARWADLSNTYTHSTSVAAPRRLFS
jgi:hypothetical protein